MSNLKDRITFADRVTNLLHRVSIGLFSNPMTFQLNFDQKYTTAENGGRLYIQIVYMANDTKKGEMKTWKGRKWYLSEHMTDDEIVKTMWLSYETAIKHELLETFKVDGRPLFNPHTPYTELLNASLIEEVRDERE